MGDGQDRTLPRKTPAPQVKAPKKRAAWLTTQKVQQAATVVGVGLNLLEGSRKTRSYAKAIRTVTDGLGLVAAANSKDLTEKLRATRSQIKELEASPRTKETAKQVKELRTQLDTYLDLFLEQ